jgi:signal transduction histidine kinase
MRLSQFMRTNSEQILAEFEAFARTIVPLNTMDEAELRDHADQLLDVIARDLDTPESAQEAIDKAQGRSDADEAGPETPAQDHGAGRAISGFTVSEMVSEYRALRESVVRLWTGAKVDLTATDLEDLIRFNGSIDQALAESTERFMRELDKTRETFLGVLGHDLRTPLGAIITSAKFILEVGDLPPTSRTLARAIVSSSTRMNAMVADLLDFTRGRLGMSIPIEPGRADLAVVLSAAVQETTAALPELDLKLETNGDLFGNWDSVRLSQVLNNLISNAVSHGSSGTPITIRAKGNAEDVVFSVHNYGRTIPAHEIEEMFDPLNSRPSPSDNSRHMGLGLYIVRDVVSAHGGTIDVQSTEADGTTFIVCLPRRARL